MAMVNARCTWVFMPLDNSRMRRLPVISVLASSAVARSRRNRGCTPATKSMAWSTRSQAGQHRDVGDEAGVVHERGAFAKRFAAQHLQLPFVGGESEDGAQSAGLAGAVRADEADDAARLPRRKLTRSSATCAPYFLVRSRASMSADMMILILP